MFKFTCVAAALVRVRSGNWRLGAVYLFLHHERNWPIKQHATQASWWIRNSAETGCGVDFQPTDKSDVGTSALYTVSKLYFWVVAAVFICAGGQGTVSRYYFPGSEITWSLQTGRNVFTFPDRTIQRSSRKLPTRYAFFYIIKKFKLINKIE